MNITVVRTIVQDPVDVVTELLTDSIGVWEENHLAQMVEVDVQERPLGLWRMGWFARPVAQGSEWQLVATALVTPFHRLFGIFPKVKTSKEYNP